MYDPTSLENRVDNLAGYCNSILRELDDPPRVTIPEWHAKLTMDAGMACNIARHIQDMLKERAQHFIRTTIATRRDEVIP